LTYQDSIGPCINLQSCSL